MSVGTYATVAGCQARMSPGMSANDATELGVFCEQVNTWLETTTGRVLAPIPGFTTTLASPAASGDTIVQIEDGAGLAVGDVLLFDIVTADPHESALVTEISDPIASGVTIVDVTLATPLEHGYASGTTVKRVYVYDGYDAVEGGRAFPIGRGIRRIISLEVTPVTAGEGGTRPMGTNWFLLPRQDYWIRTTPQERTAGWPATELRITNIPTPGNSTPLFFGGYNNVRIDADLGWPSVLPDVVGLAERIVIALWQMRASGGAYPTFPDGVEMTVPRLLSVTDWQLLRRYTYDPVLVI